MLLALALCHNVTPVYDDENKKDYQASSPDEIALVKFSEEIGICLVHRDQNSITLQGNFKKRGESGLNDEDSSFNQRKELSLVEEESKQVINASDDLINDNPNQYEILALFPFNSETKRMGIIIKHKGTGRIIFYLKGAEVTMEKTVQKTQKSLKKMFRYGQFTVDN